MLKQNKFTINTGEARNVLGNAISGAIASALISGTNNTLKVKNKEISIEKAIKNTGKDAIFGAIVTATAINTSNILGDHNKGIFQALGSITLGALAIYSLKKYNSKGEKIGQLK